jgi:hypothetical protein
MLSGWLCALPLQYKNTVLLFSQLCFHTKMSSCGPKDSTQVVQGLQTSVEMQQSATWVNTLSHADCNVGEPHHG